MKRILAAILWLSLASLATAETTPPPKVQCAGITKNGKQCKRTVKPPAVYCWQHAPKNIIPCTTDTDCLKKNPKK